MRPSREVAPSTRKVERDLAMLERAVNEIFEVLRASSATAVFLAGASVLITEPALTLLTPEEL
jgi:hypothetical protein